MARFSVSEIQQFQRCRRMWDLQSQNRKGLVPVGGAPQQLWVGSMFHHALDEAVKGENPVKAMATHIRSEGVRFQEEYKASIGAAPSEAEEDRFYQIAGEALALVEGYFAHWGHEHPLGEEFEYIQSEVTFEINVPFTRNHLIGTTDGIARHLPSGKLWLVEHKTFSQKPTYDKLTTDWQMSAYLWAMEMLFDESFEGVIYDGISKKPGAWEKYIRHQIRMPRAVLLQTEQTLTEVTRLMAEPQVPIFPNFTWQGCFDCSVRDICKAMTFGEDVEWLLKEHYRRGSGHATRRRMDNARSEVQSIADLERARKV